MSEQPATSTVTLTTRPDVHVIDLGATENRFSPTWMEQVHSGLDDALAAPAPLVVTASGKFFSNGLDLDWLGANPDRFGWYVTEVERLFERVLTLPLPTVAAVNGHAFGAGAMIAMGCDWRVMREDRGYFCFPEVDIDIPFTAGMDALVRSKLTPRTAVDAMTTGRRYAGPDAVAVGLVDATAGEADLLERAAAMVAPLAGKSVDTLGAIKRTMFASVSAQLLATR